jgi:glycosyltransferase involved in cell wall biosynthesis
MLVEMLVAKLESPLPARWPTGQATSVFLLGNCFHDSDEVKELVVLVDGVRHQPTAQRMPRPDLTPDPRSPAYRSGFWATVPVPTRDRPGAVELAVAVRLASGREQIAALGRLEVVEADQVLGEVSVAVPPTEGLIAVCMTTFEPNIELLGVQLDSLRAQTDDHWVCVISDDCSSPDRFEQIEQAVAGDRRFTVSRSERRLGFYNNFERALELAPAAAPLIALCDQDDRWYPHKLETLRAGLGKAQLVYSDQRLVTEEGQVLRGTLWEGRRNNHTSLTSLLVANTITGAATLFRREVAELALPFPDAPGLQFHDHWLGLVALASGEISYIERPLYDYVQHSGAVFGEVSGGSEASTAAPGRFMSRWRAAYFYGYLGLEVQASVLLVRCSARLSARKRRALRRFVASGRSAPRLAWLALRALRALAGRNETLGGETELVRGVLWRWLVDLRGRAGRIGGPPADATFPQAGPESYRQDRLRRWRAGAAGL